MKYILKLLYNKKELLRNIFFVYASMLYVFYTHISYKIDIQSISQNKTPSCIHGSKTYLSDNRQTGGGRVLIAIFTHLKFGREWGMDGTDEENGCRD